MRVGRGPIESGQRSSVLPVCLNAGRRESKQDASVVDNSFEFALVLSQQVQCQRMAYTICASRSRGCADSIITRTRTIFMIAAELSPVQGRGPYRNRLRLGYRGARARSDSSSNRPSYSRGRSRNASLRNHEQRTRRRRHVGAGRRRCSCSFPTPHMICLGSRYTKKAQRPPGKSLFLPFGSRCARAG